MAPSLRALVSYASNFLSQLPLFDSNLRNVSPYEPLSGAPRCPIDDGPMSCHNKTAVAGDSCCFVHPGGRILLIQSWDQRVPASGIEEDWTLRGLRPVLCDGTHHDQYCHLAPYYTDIATVLRNYGQDDLLKFMSRYWPAASGPNSLLWETEYNNYATCINTLSPRCYGAAHKPGLEVVDYFTRAAALFRTLDTYRALEKAGIVPDSGRHYALADVQRALERFTGGKVMLKCNGGGADILQEVRYVYFIKGSLQTGQFVPAQDLGREEEAGNCAPLVRYLPKRPKGEL